MKTLLYSALILTLIACQSKRKETYTAQQVIPSEVATEQHPGLEMLETYCYVCHSPTATMDDRVAPPMAAVKMHYISEETSKEDFTNEFLSFLAEPTEDKAKMRGAIRKFGLMPAQKFPEEALQQIAEYLYEHEIETPAWFEQHRKEEMGKGKGHGKGHGAMQHASPKEKGMKMATSTKAELGKNLMGTIQREGTLAALKFCSERAYPLTDSMATVHQAKIRRVSDKPRNPNNRATSEEEAYINRFKLQVAKEGTIEPIIVSEGNSYNFYYPIVTNTMCLQCHGTPNATIASATFEKIRELYPNDEAIGYSENEVRGIWSISF